MKERAEKPNKHAVLLGRRAAGVPKQFSADELARRTAILQKVNARRRRARKAVIASPRKSHDAPVSANTISAK